MPDCVVLYKTLAEREINMHFFARKIKHPTEPALRAILSSQRLYHLLVESTLHSLNIGSEEALLERFLAPCPSPG